MSSVLKTLAEDIAAACKTTLKTEAIKIVDRSSAVYEDDSGTEECCPEVGTLYTYRIVRTGTRHAFGWRWLAYEKHHLLVRFNGEVNFGSGRLVWPTCTVFDPRLEAPVRTLFQRVERSHYTVPYRTHPSFTVERTGA